MMPAEEVAGLYYDQAGDLIERARNYRARAARLRRRGRLHRAEYMLERMRESVREARRFGTVARMQARLAREGA